MDTLAGKIKSRLIPFPFTCELIVVFLHLKADVKLSLWYSTVDRLQLCVTTPNAYLWLNEDQLWQITFWWLYFDLEPENRMAIYSFIWHTFIRFLPGPLHEVCWDLTNIQKPCKYDSAISILQIRKIRHRKWSENLLRDCIATKLLGFDLGFLADSLEKTLMLGNTEGRRRRGWQRMR